MRVNEYMEMTERIMAIPRAEHPELVWALRRGEWDDRLGSKPENWEDMDQNERINASKMQIEYLESHVSKKELDRYFLTHYLQYTDQQFEDTWDSVIMKHFEDWWASATEKKLDDYLSQNGSDRTENGGSKSHLPIMLPLSAFFGCFIGQLLVRIIFRILEIS